jgi:hypothetical protein
MPIAEDSGRIARSLERLRHCERREAHALALENRVRDAGVELVAPVMREQRVGAQVGDLTSGSRNQSDRVRSASDRRPDVRIPVQPVAPPLAVAVRIRTTFGRRPIREVVSAGADRPTAAARLAMPIRAKNRVASS